MFRNDHGQPVWFGLGNTNEKTAKKKMSDIRKSSDYIGYTMVEITPEMVGHTLAVFTSIEFKKPGFKIKAVYPERSREAKQLVWINMCLRAGAIGGFAFDHESMDAIYEEFYARFR